MSLLVDGEKVAYTTKTAHGTHSAGTECVAYRKNKGEILVLEFGDGDVVELGSGWYAEGLEDPNPIKRLCDREVLAAFALAT